MKQLFILVMLVPVLSFGQKFEISEQAGISIPNSSYYSYFKNGFSNQVTFSYHPINLFSISAFYELNSWDGRLNSFGISPDFVFKCFYAGIDLKTENFAPLSGIGNWPVGIEYNSTPVIGYGAHIGSRQKIYKGLSAIEQIGYEVQSVTGFSVPTALATENRYQFTETMKYYYLRAGLSYRL